MSLHKRCGPDLSPPLTCPKSPRCDHHWHYDIRVNGRRYRSTTETDDKQKAKDIEARERAKILEGQHGIRRQSKLTLRELWKLYLDNFASVEHKQSTLQRERVMWKTIDRHLGSHQIALLTKFTLEQYRAKRLTEGVTPATVNREFSIIGGMLRRAVEWKHLAASPASGIKKLKGAGQRTRILTPDEQRALLAAYRQGRRIHVYPIIALLMATGARLSEVLNLKWADCTGDYVRFVDTKNGHSRRLPMDESIRTILADVPRTDEYVFVSYRTDQKFRKLRTGFLSALKAAGITTGDVCLHTLRHTALSRMCEAGMDLRTVQEISGHRSLAMLQRYTHPTEQRKLDALRTFGAILDTTRPQSTAAEVVNFNSRK